MLDLIYSNTSNPWLDVVFKVLSINGEISQQIESNLTEIKKCYDKNADIPEKI